MRIKKISLKNRIGVAYQSSVSDEFRNAEREFGEMLSTHWDVVNTNPHLQKKAMVGAKRLKELRLLLIKRRFMSNTLQ